MWKEFKEFLQRGNVIELAVGLAMGAAFIAVVNSFTNDIVMPIVGTLLGGIDFSSLSIQVGDATIAYGNFIQAIVTFVIIAFVLFLVVKAYNKMIKSKKESAADTPAGPTDVDLLTEIRDLLKARNS